MMNVCDNGQFCDVTKPLLTAQNRSFKWGDGLFETMKVYRGKLLLEEVHSERLFISLKLLQVEKNVDDALLINASNFLCDSTKANIFLVKGNEIITPALHQGCINGVMRRVVIDEVKKIGYRLRQQEVSEEDLLTADEAFLTNA